MTVDETKELLKSSSYDFLRNNKHLGKNLILLAYGGSYAYGMNNENSDVDIRGVAVRSAKEILTGQDFEQVVETNTDTTIYSFNKIVKLLSNCNPNTIEILGLKPEHYFYKSEIGQMLLDHKDLFLSKVAVHSFGGYANTQLRRLENKSARLTSQAHQEENILKSIQFAEVDFRQKFLTMPEDSIKLYIDTAVNPDYESEIFMDANFSHYPLRDYHGMMNCIGEIVKSYAKIGKRNEKAIEHNKLGKHMAHLVRLYYMCFDILERGEVITYREKEHNLLMDIRNGNYLDENRQVTSDFYGLVIDLERRLQYDKEHTELPEKPDYNKINEFVAEVNRRIVIDNM